MMQRHDSMKCELQDSVKQSCCKETLLVHTEMQNSVKKNGLEKYLIYLIQKYPSNCSFEWNKQYLLCENMAFKYFHSFAKHINRDDLFILFDIKHVHVITSLKRGVT